MSKITGAIFGLAIVVLSGLSGAFHADAIRTSVTEVRDLTFYRLGYISVDKAENILELYVDEFQARLRLENDLEVALNAAVKLQEQLEGYAVHAEFLANELNKELNKGFFDRNFRRKSGEAHAAVPKIAFTNSEPKCDTAELTAKVFEVMGMERVIEKAKAEVMSLGMPEVSELFDSAVPALMNDVLDYYAKNFTCEELQAINKFYSTDIGQSIADKAFDLGVYAQKRMLYHLMVANGASEESAATLAGL